MFEMILGRFSGAVPRFEHLLGEVDLSTVPTCAVDEIKQLLASFPAHDKALLLDWVERSQAILDRTDLSRHSKLKRLQTLNPSESTMSFLKSSFEALIGYLPSQHRGLAHRTAHDAAAEPRSPLLQSPLLQIGQLALKKGLPIFLLSEQGDRALKFLRRNIKTADLN